MSNISGNDETYLKPDKIRTHQSYEQLLSLYQHY